MGFHLFSTFIPYYGFCIFIGFVCAFLIGYILCKINKLDINDFIILSAYLIAFGFIGAKFLYILVSIKSINTKYIFSSLYNFNNFISSGFVFYGGLIGGLLGLIFVKKIHNININYYYKLIVPCLGITHFFGRIGCSLAGCCYGKKTNCFIYFKYKNSLIAPNNIKLFPIQGIEAFFILLITIFCLILVLKKTNIKIEKLYLLIYSVLRFILEFERGDIERGKILFFSTSQIISLLILIVIITTYIINYKVSHKKMVYNKVRKLG